MHRRKMLFGLLGVAALMVALPSSADKGSPSFNGNIWGDGQLWGTKFAHVLPPPNDHNEQSYDKLYIIVNSNNPDGQNPVAEAAPGNPDYNGGRWWAQTVEWTEAGFEAHGTVPVLTSYAELLVHYGLGHLTITPGHPDPNSPTYFECPLLPVK